MKKYKNEYLVEVGVGDNRNVAMLLTYEQTSKWHAVVDVREFNVHENAWYEVLEDLLEKVKEMNPRAYLSVSKDSKVIDTGELSMSEWLELEFFLLQEEADKNGYYEMNDLL